MITHEVLTSIDPRDQEDNQNIGLGVVNRWFSSINFFYNKNNSVPLINFLHHLVELFLFLAFITTSITPKSILLLLIFLFFIANVYNTIWFHRFCSHRSFRFSHRYVPLFFLFTNPISFKEESYVIPHYLHHKFSDTNNDLYGPKLGRLGSYLAQESLQVFNVKISKAKYGELLRTLNHIPAVKNNYRDFKRTGSVENLYFYFGRLLFAQLFWNSLFFLVGGMSLVLTWHAAVFVIWFLIRDFNWWGHGGFNSKPSEYEPRNQKFFGYIASEWHKNHHLYPNSANTAFLPRQFDLSFMIIRLLKNIGIVSSYRNYKEQFQSQTKFDQNISKF